MSKLMKSMDGNEACAYVSYAFTEVATIYPITPSSPMAEHVDEWSANGKKNMFGQAVRLMEMESEAGACGAMHGALETGCLATSYTSSQGLMLMIPPMFRIAGQLHPGVLHVSARTVGTQAFTIFGDHSDVMATRQTGFAMLCSSSVQEIMDLAGVAHLSAIKGRVPFLHFFDGFRTSHEIQKVEVMDYDDLAQLLDKDALKAFRKRSLNPERPVQRSIVVNPDVYFQIRESLNPFYNKLPDVVEEYMNKINEITGRNYKLFNYYGAPDAQEVVVAMGSVDGVIREVVDYLNNSGRKVGYVQVHLYRPFSVKHFLRELPESVRKIAVLDRTKEAGSIGEPLYLDICAATAESDRNIKVYGGRYGLSIKDVMPNQIKAVFDELLKEQPKNHFTVGIDDDVTHTSLSVGKALDVLPEGTISCKFWGLGSDGTVGANKNSIKIIGDHTDQYVQAYFEYDSKKSGGVTRSHLRFGKNPISGSYLVTSADFVACHNQSYIQKYEIAEECKKGGTFLLNSIWNDEELEGHLPNRVKKYIAQNDIKFYTIDAVDIAKKLGLGHRTNTILQSAFFKLADIIDYDDAVKYMKDAIKDTYGNKGQKVINMNFAAVDEGGKSIHKVEIPASWKDLPLEKEKIDPSLPEFVKKLMIPVNGLKGDYLPVSAFSGMEDGTVPPGTSKYEKRGTAIDVPEWDPDKCIQCNMCSFVCPHAAIRPYLLSPEELEKAPASYKHKPATGGDLKGYAFSIQVSPLDCLGCGVCIEACPAKEKAISFKPIESQLGEENNWEYSQKLAVKKTKLRSDTVKGSQFETPLLEFSGACAGCGETPYAKLLTQMFGDRLIIANATGCTQAWGAAFPSNPYTTNSKGHGPAFSNSLFENNAEFSLGMCLSITQQREATAGKLKKLKEKINDEELKKAIDDWFDGYDDESRTTALSETLVERLTEAKLQGEADALKNEILFEKENLTKKSMWMYGGDGWAYDIGFGGLDHVIASGQDVNILVVDTEVYSNTGGQASKATQIGAVAQFASSGKKTKKKDLGLMAMQYEYCYVAQVAMGADPAQLVRVMAEAEKYHGPSLIIAYAPCINHGIVKGMGYSGKEAKAAVESGYWNLYHYNPDRVKEGLNPFVLDSKDPTMNLREFLMGEVRFAALTRTFPEEAEKLLAEAEVDAKERHESYKKLAM